MDILSDPAVIWFLIGLGLLLLELVLPGLVILFFGAGAWVAALSCALFNINLNWQIAIFLLASLLGLVLLRKYLKRKFFGRKAKAIADFADGQGKIEFKGTQ